MKYEWARRRLHGDLEAQVAGEHLESLVEKHDGYLTAEEILADARSTRSPLHPVFAWDDDVAAEKYRRHQATQMASALVVKTKDKKKTRAFVFVKVPKHGRKCWVPIRSAMGTPEIKAQVLEQALKGLERWIGAYGGTAALRRFTKDVDRLRRKIEVEYMTAAGLI